MQINVGYSVVTPESVEDGDVSESGLLVENRPLSKGIRYARGFGDFQYNGAVLETTTATFDKDDNSLTDFTVALRFKRELKPAVEVSIYKKLIRLLNHT